MEFSELFDSVMKRFEDGATFALATISDGKPSVRTMCGFSLADKIYFQTDSLMDKVADIKENANIAICIGEIQIQGICIELGHPLNNENSWFIEKYKEIYPEAYTKYSHVRTEKIYEIKPTYIKIWSKQGKVPIIIYIDVDKRKYEIKLFEEY